MSSVQTRTGMSLDDYMQRYVDEGRFEIIDEQVVYMSPHTAEHIFIVRWLFRVLDRFLLSSADWDVLQEASFAQIVFDTPNSANWVKGSFEPDIMIVSKTKLAEWRATQPDWKRWPITVVPALVIEVVSPNDRYQEIMDKITAYRRLGVLIVWLVDLHQQTVSIFEPGKDAPEVINGDKALTSPEWLPGLTLSLAEMFAAE